MHHRHTYDKPIYAVDTYITRTGTPDAYVPKGSWSNPQKRNWKKFEVGARAGGAASHYLWWNGRIVHGGNVKSNKHLVCVSPLTGVDPPSRDQELNVGLDSR